MEDFQSGEEERGLQAKGTTLSKVQKSGSGGSWTFQEKNVLYVHSLWSFWNTVPSGRPSSLVSECSSQNVLPRMTLGPEQDSVEAVLESVCKCSIQNHATCNNISVGLFHTFRIQEDCFVSVSSLSWDPVASYDVASSSS